MPCITDNVSLAGREEEKEITQIAQPKSFFTTKTCGSSLFATKRYATTTTTTTYGKPVIRPFARHVPFLSKKALWFGRAESPRKPIAIDATARECPALGYVANVHVGSVDSCYALPLSVARADADRRLRRLQREALDRDIREAYAVGRKRSALLDAARGYVQPRIDYVKERDAFQRHLQQLANAGRATKPSSRPTFPVELWDMLHDRLEGLDHWSGIVVDRGAQSADLDEVFPELIDAAFAMSTQQDSGTVKALRATVNKFNARAARSRHHRNQIPFRAPLPRLSANIHNPPQTIDEAMEMLALAIRVIDIKDGSKTEDWEFAVYDLIYGSDESVDPEMGYLTEIDSDVQMDAD